MGNLFAISLAVLIVGSSAHFEHAVHVIAHVNGHWIERMVMGSVYVYASRCLCTSDGIIYRFTLLIKRLRVYSFAFDAFSVLNGQQLT